MEKINLRADMKQALSTLTPFERQLIVRTLEGWTQQELADELKIDRRTVGRRLVQIQKTLQRLLSSSDAPKLKNLHYSKWKERAKRIKKQRSEIDAAIRSKVAYRCMVCGARTTSGFWVCGTCALEANLGVRLPDGNVQIHSFINWPGWARQEKRDFEQQLRQEALQAAYEVSYEDLIVIELDGDASDMSIDDERVHRNEHPLLPNTIERLLVEGWLQYAPYDDKKTNRQYRKSVGIPNREELRSYGWKEV